MSEATLESATFAVPQAAADRAVLRLRLRAHLRALWLRRLFGRESELAGRRVNPEVEAALRGLDTAERQQAFLAADPEARELVQRLDQVELALSSTESRLSRVERLFGLDAAERDLLQACFAAAVDPTLLRAFAFLSDPGRPVLTPELLARLFDHGPRRALAPESPLQRWELLREEPLGPGEPQALSIDPHLRQHLLGGGALDPALLPVALVHEPRPPLPRWPVEELAARIASVLESSGRIRVRIQGTPGSGRRTLAGAAAGRIPLPLLVIDADRVDDERWPSVFLRAQRQAYLDGTALAFCGEAALRRHWPEPVPVFPLQFLICEPGQTAAPLRHAVDHAVEVPQPSLAERAALIRGFVPASARWQPAEIEAVAARHRLTVGEIAELGRRPISVPADAAALLRESTRHRLGDLARFMECPFTSEDLVLSPALRRGLEELIFEAGERVSFWEQPVARRLFPQGQGLCALFTGPPGTGKTMAAQVVAARLGLDLFRISLSAVVSKYVGETAKNVKAVLARAQEMDAVLLFDEADALFGKRTEIKDAHDRFANTDTNHLLQAIEAYQGVALLASNKKANIDQAFMRRIRVVLEFDRPSAAERRELWTRLVGELAGAHTAQALSAGLLDLAAQVDATGAQIKYAVLGGIFAARQERAELALPHLLRGLERELVKEGRSLRERDREKLSSLPQRRGSP